MDINNALSIDDELMFCEEGNRLAYEVIAATKLAIAGVGGAISVAEAETEVNTPLRKLYFHFANCDSCQEN